MVPEHKNDISHKIDFFIQFQFCVHLKGIDFLSKLTLKCSPLVCVFTQKIVLQNSQTSHLKMVILEKTSKCVVSVFLEELIFSGDLPDTKQNTIIYKAS